jgi:hypothetical protein
VPVTIDVSVVEEIDRLIVANVDSELLEHKNQLGIIQLEAQQRA